MLPKKHAQRNIHFYYVIYMYEFKFENLISMNF
jgi:hypothetical protein